MNANLNFKLDFGTNRIDIIFNESEDAQIFTVKDTWESRQYGNVITHLINVDQPHYQVIESGLMLHRSFEVTELSFEDKNVGYVLGIVLTGLIESGRVVHNKSVVASSVYKLAWDGFEFHAMELKWTEYVEGEPAFVGQNRNATHLVKKLTQLFRAQERGMNIRLLFTEATNGYLTLKKAQWELYTNGYFAELAEMIKQDISKKAVYNTVRHYEAIAAKVLVADGEVFVAQRGSFEVRDFDNNVVDEKDMVGKTIQFVQGKTVLQEMYPVTNENLETMIASLKKRCAKIVFAEVQSSRNQLLPA